MDGYSAIAPEDIAMFIKGVAKAKKASVNGEFNRCLHWEGHLI